MRKINLFISFLMLNGAIFAQKTILVNGGQFGNSQENVNVMIYDTQTKTTSVIDTIHTSSVQDILIDGDDAFVFAQDSIIKYDLTTESRIASTQFAGVSTKTASIVGNELLVSNWYAKTSDNLYVYDKGNLTLLDSVTNVNQGVTSMLVDSGYVYLNQNSSTGAPNYQDTLGLILKVNIATRSIVDSIQVANYSLEIGEFLPNSNGLGFYSINSTSNTITSVNFATKAATNTSFNQDFKVGNRSQYHILGDTAFLRMNEGIGSINLNTLNVIDSLIIDTVITAFTYDTVTNNFYVTQTDFFSYKQGGVYGRNGNKLDSLAVGFSPEVIKMYYNQTVGLVNVYQREKNSLSVFPNPSSGLIQLDSEQSLNNDAQLLIYNQQGQLVKSVFQLNAQNQINLNGLERGIYIARLINGKEMLTQKIILQ